VSPWALPARAWAAMVGLAIGLWAPISRASAQHAFCTPPPERTCQELGLASGGVVRIDGCGLDIGGCLACREGPDVLCTQVGMAGVHAATRGFRIADGRDRVAVAWASSTLTWLLVVDRVLDVEVVSPHLPLAITGDYAIAPTRSGWLFAFMSARGVEVAALDRHGALRRSPTVIVADTAETELDLVPVHGEALLVVDRHARGLMVFRVTPAGTSSSPGELPRAWLPLHGATTHGSRAIVAAYRPDGRPPRQGDVVVAWVGRGRVAYGDWHPDTLGGIGAMDAPAAELDVALPLGQPTVLTLRMHASPTGTLDEVIPARGRRRRFVTDRAEPRGLYAPIRAEQPPILGAAHARVRSLDGTLSIGLVPSFVVELAHRGGEPAPGAVAHGAQLPIALSGPGRGTRGIRDRARRARQPSRVSR